MFTLKITNSRGTSELTHSSGWAVTEITGLAYPKIAVSTAGGGGDGSIFGAARPEQRNIVITAVLRGDIEQSRQALYRIFPMKEPLTVYYENSRRAAEIIGYCESLDGTFFTREEQMQISLICPMPYFSAPDPIHAELSAAERYFEFPFAIAAPIPFSGLTDTPMCTIENTGDVPCGITADIAFTGAASVLTLYCPTTGEMFRLDTDFEAGDRVRLCTRPESLSVTRTRGGSTVSMIPYIAAGSVWFRAPVGSVQYTYAVQEGSAFDIRADIALTPLWGGV